MKTSMRNWGTWCLDFLYPRTCTLCGCSVPRDGAFYYVCPSCEEALPWIQEPCCTVCSGPFSGEVSGERVCPRCIELDPVFSHGRALFQLKGCGRTLVHVLKYAKGNYLAADLARLIQRVPRCEDFLRGAVLVPVPLFPRKERSRGYNQSTVIARAWAQSVPGCEVQNILRRIRATPSQTGLSREDRFSNVKNAFAISKKAVLDADTQYILIDDVFTTGSTLNACAQVLRDAGARSLGVAVLSHG